MSKFDGIDAAILSAIKGGHSDFGAIARRPYVAKLAKEHATATKPEFRVIDARLQALRKAGKIRFTRESGWQMADGAAGAKG